MYKTYLKFLGVLIGLYLALSYFFDFWIGLCAPGGFYWAFAEQHLNFVQYYREFLIGGSELLANSFGLQTISNSTQMRIIGHGGVNIVYSCVGFGMISLIIAIGMAAPSKKIKQRLLFIAGMVVLFTILNMGRIFTIAYYS